MFSKFRYRFIGRLYEKANEAMGLGKKDLEEKKEEEEKEEKQIDEDLFEGKTVDEYVDTIAPESEEVFKGDNIPYAVLFHSEDDPVVMESFSLAMAQFGLTMDSGEGIILQHDDVLQYFDDSKMSLDDFTDTLYSDEMPFDKEYYRKKIRFVLTLKDNHFVILRGDGVEGMTKIGKNLFTEAEILERIGRKTKEPEAA